MAGTAKRWKVLPRAEKAFFGQMGSLPPLFAQLLFNRGIRTFADWQAAAGKNHQAPPPDLPPALAVIDPHLENNDYPYTGLAAVGVVYKLVQAIYERLGTPMDESLLELVAIGTVADVAPLTGENHKFVREGLIR